MDLQKSVLATHNFPRGVSLELLLEAISLYKNGVHWRMDNDTAMSTIQRHEKLKSKILKLSSKYLEYGDEQLVNEWLNAPRDDIDVNSYSERSMLLDNIVNEKAIELMESFDPYLANRILSLLAKRYGREAWLNTWRNQAMRMAKWILRAATGHDWCLEELVDIEIWLKERKERK